MKEIVSKKILAIIGIACLFLGTFLPFFTIKLWIYSDSISLWRYWEGKVVLVLALANLLFVFKDGILKSMPQLFNNSLGNAIKKVNNAKFSLIPTGLIGAFLIYTIFSVDVDFKYISYGAGFWMLWAGVIFLIVHAILYKGNITENTKQSVTVESTQFVNSQQSFNTMNNVENTGPKYCPQCGTQVSSNTTVCTKCGHNF